MALLGGRRTPSLVGLDIQANEVIAAEVSHGRGQLKRAAAAPLPPGLVHEGEFTDPQALSAALKSFFQQHKLHRHVRLGVANQRVVVRAMELPVIERREDLDAAIRFQAGERLPMPLEDAVLDYQVIERFSDENGTAHDRVVLVAAPRQMVEGMMAVVRGAGLKLAGIDVGAFALIRALHGAAGNGIETVVEPNGEDPAAAGVDRNDGGVPVTPQAADAVAYCHLGAVTSLAVAHGPNCLFARTMPYGMEAIERKLAESREMPIADARRWLTYVGLARELGELEGDADFVAACRAALEEGVAQLSSVVQASLDYYAAQPEARNVRKVLVSGPGTEIGGLVAALGELVPGTVEVAQPPARTDEIAPAHLALAYGLAIDEVAA